MMSSTYHWRATIYLFIFSNFFVFNVIGEFLYLSFDPMDFSLFVLNAIKNLLNKCKIIQRFFTLFITSESVFPLFLFR